MNRLRLIWFAAGAACSSIITVSAHLATRSAPAEDAWFLRVAEDWQSQNTARGAVVWRGAEIARDCGARSFEMMPGFGSDGVDATRVPLVKENNRALNCIVEQATKANLWLGVGLEPVMSARAIDWGG